MNWKNYETKIFLRRKTVQIQLLKVMLKALYMYCFPIQINKNFIGFKSVVT